ncbi:hypothetical protein SprV_0702349400 [Sparganum proliferum]
MTIFSGAFEDCALNTATEPDMRWDMGPPAAGYVKRRFTINRDETVFMNQLPPYTEYNPPPQITVNGILRLLRQHTLTQHQNGRQSGPQGLQSPPPTAGLSDLEPHSPPQHKTHDCDPSQCGGAPISVSNLLDLVMTPGEEEKEEEEEEEERV